MGEEHKQCRENVVLIDQSSFAKFEISGAEAYAEMQRLCSNFIGNINFTNLFIVLQDHRAV